MKNSTIYHVRGLLCQFLYTKIFTLSILFLLFSILSGKRCGAQGLPVAEITTGQVIPESVWNLPLEVVRHPKGEKTVRLSDFRGKLIVIDFWATWCGPCVSMMPKMEDLEQKFAGRINFISVTDQKAAIVNSFMPLQEKKIGRKLPMFRVVNDKILSRYFPHRTIPHLVWINEKGTVEAISDFAALSADAIDKMLNKESANIKLKKDLSINYTPEKPIFLNQNGGNGGQVISQSVLSAYVPGLSLGYSIRKDSLNGWRMSIRNLPPSSLFAYAYGEGKRLFTEKNTIFMLSDSTLYRPDKTEDTMEWFARNSYCYELLLPYAMRSEAYKIMKTDLERFFPQYKAKIKVQKTKCLALTLTGPPDRIKTAGGEKISAFEPFGFKLQNKSLALLIAQLDNVYMQNKLKVIDNTAYYLPVDLEIRADMSSVDELNKALAPYSLKLIESHRKIEMLVISDDKEIPSLIGNIKRNPKLSAR